MRLHSVVHHCCLSRRLLCMHCGLCDNTYWQLSFNMTFCYLLLLLLLCVRDDTLALLHERTNDEFNSKDCWGSGPFILEDCICYYLELWHSLSFSPLFSGWIRFDYNISCLYSIAVLLVELHFQTKTENILYLRTKALKFSDSFHAINFRLYSAVKIY